MGRKNWLFSNTPNGAKASAVYYSLIVSAKENKLVPFEYLTKVFTEASNSAALEALCPGERDRQFYAYVNAALVKATLAAKKYDMSMSTYYRKARNILGH